MSAILQNTIHIGLIEDQHIFREGIKALVAGWPQIEVTFETAEGYTIVEKLKSSSPLPDVLLVDYSLPPQGDIEFNGVHVIQAVSTHFPDIKIIVLSMHEDEHFIARMIENGARGHLVKDSDPDEVRLAILSVHEKGSYINERTLRAIQNNMGKKPKVSRDGNGLIQISKREKEVLDLICRQYKTEEIAEKLFISSKTVDGHRNNLLQKTDSRNTAGLVVYALRNHIVSIF
ncbi:response regulator transcription factor [Pedobacter gandavensis]|uniref:response regulator transcription factor n=1 Tax=Pedobacter gandavensis TaxID=2679963 RepID=UPI00292DF6FD|nr:response regulator transcription factor [Pedobacter gandavensis]